MMHTIIDASDRFRGKSKGGLYGGVVEEFDYETGRLLDALEELGLSENTLFIYTSDNGPWNQDKYTKNKKGHPEGSIFGGSSGPLRNGKGSPYEGGYRLPCIVRWPGKVPAGRKSDAVFATIDFMPTFAKLCGFKAPADRVIDGVDQTALLTGQVAKGEGDLLLRPGGHPERQVEIPFAEGSFLRVRPGGRPSGRGGTLRPEKRLGRDHQPGQEAPQDRGRTAVKSDQGTATSQVGVLQRRESLRYPPFMLSFQVNWADDPQSQVP